MTEQQPEQPDPETQRAINEESAAIQDAMKSYLEARVVQQNVEINKLRARVAELEAQEADK